MDSGPGSLTVSSFRKKKTPRFPGAVWYGCALAAPTRGLRGQTMLLHHLHILADGAISFEQ